MKLYVTEILKNQSILPLHCGLYSTLKQDLPHFLKLQVQATIIKDLFVWIYSPPIKKDCHFITQPVY